MLRVMKRWRSGSNFLAYIADRLETSRDFCIFFETSVISHCQEEDPRQGRYYFLYK